MSARQDTQRSTDITLRARRALLALAPVKAVGRGCFVRLAKARGSPAAVLRIGGAYLPSYQTRHRADGELK